MSEHVSNAEGRQAPMERPAVSIVVPFHVVDDRLMLQVRKLMDDSSSELSELVLACNAADALGEARLAFRGFDDRLILVDATAVRGPSFARNAGWRAAVGDLILFCDSDDEIDFGWTESLAEAVRAGGIATGPLEWARLWPESLPRDAIPQPRVRPVVPFGYLPFGPTCNLGVAKSLLEDLEGFDESLAAAEDIDLCWRAHQLGYPLEFADDALVHYRHASDRQALFAKSITYAVYEKRLLAKHDQVARGRGAQWFLGLAKTGVKNLAKMPFAPRSASIPLVAVVGTVSGHLLSQGLAMKLVEFVRTGRLTRRTPALPSGENG